jgi:hypothetical protein
MEKESVLSRLGWGFGVGAVSLSLSSGCSVQSPSPEASQRTSGTSEALLGICTPQTCCFPSGGGWADNPFEEGLRALGCSEPQAYTQSYGQADWWLYSTCPGPSVALTNLVLEYATVSPYYSQLVVNLCLEAHAIGDTDLTEVFVQWDPTCSQCSYRFDR